MTSKRHRKRMARELAPMGTTLHRRFKGETRTATIVEPQNLPKGNAVECEGGRYTRLSAAPKPITGHAVNGWRFWQIVEAQPSESA